jgi:hypothetical protein
MTSASSPSNSSAGCATGTADGEAGLTTPPSTGQASSLKSSGSFRLRLADSCW